MPYPAVGVADCCGCCKTPLIEIVSCAARVASAPVPLLYVALNFVLMPSKATFRVCESPAPSAFKLIAVPDAASLAFNASCIVFLSIFMAY